MIVDLPYKVTNSIIVNSTLYFMANLRREPGPFFYFLLVAFTMGLSMSMFFRLFASMTKTIAQALAPSSIILMLLILYTGFVIPIQYMRGYVSHRTVMGNHTEFIIAGQVGCDISIQLPTVSKMSWSTSSMARSLAAHISFLLGRHTRTLLPNNERVQYKAQYLDRILLAALHTSRLPSRMSTVNDGQTTESSWR